MTDPSADLPQEPAETWAIVELLGHVTYGARLSSATIAGAALIRLDIPTDADMVTKYIGTGGLYAITHCDENYARVYQLRYGQRPLRQLPAPRPAPLLNLAEIVEDPEYDEDDDYFNDCDPWDEPPKPKPAA